MAECNKTIVMRGDGPQRDLSLCPLCNAKMLPEASGNSRKCPQCGFLKNIRNTLDVGAIVGEKYRLLNRLGAGGCGDVFLCHPLENAGMRYVLKLLRDTSSPHMLRRFLREAELLKNIQEPRIVKLVDSWSDQDGSFIVLEYVDGKNLADLQSEFNFDEKTVLLLIQEAAVALAYAWDKFSITHRDIKPDNIMLDSRGHIRILDFGLSKSMDEDSHTEITMEMAGLGTPGFMSPEQFCDFKHADFRSDIFALGATACFLFTGKSPFSGDTNRKIYESTVQNSPPPARVLAPYCSGDTIELIRWMMQKDVESRPASYQELLAEIARIRQLHT
ncbi:MAG: protein kinase [Lentisphaeria bacterium]|nr:protein kinase [Lentisphaeria bacterium]